MSVWNAKLSVHSKNNCAVRNEHFMYKHACVGNLKHFNNQNNNRTAALDVNLFSRLTSSALAAGDQTHFEMCMELHWCKNEKFSHCVKSDNDA